MTKITILVVVFISQLGVASSLPGLNPNEWRESFVKVSADTLVPESTVSQNEAISTKNTEFVVKTPFYNKQEQYWFSVFENKIFTFNERINLLGEPESVPKTLYLNRLGVGFVSKKQRKWGLWMAYKSQSDNYINDLKTASIDLTYVNFVKKENKSNYWLWLINYSSKRTVFNGFPVLGFAYVHRYNKKLFGVYGLPFVMVNYVDFPKTMAFVQASPFGAKLRYAKGILGPIQLFASYEFKNETFVLSGRTADRDRLYYQVQGLSTGVFMPFSRKLTTQVSVSSEFDRQVYVSEQMYSARSERKILNDQLLFNVNAKYKF